METATLTLHYVKETKGCLVFEERDPKDNPLVGTLYVRKARLAGQRPTKLTLTVECA